MKKSNILWFLMILLISTSCEKDESDNSKDVIVFENLNKTIVFPNVDSIPGTCKYLFFSIVPDGQDGFAAKLFINTPDTSFVCDGYNSIFAFPLESHQVSPLPEGELIRQGNGWADTNDLNLAQFAGKGSRYIAYRSCFYPEGNINYKYGWINIEVSPNQDTIRIISSALNQTTNNSILAGQVE